MACTHTHRDGRTSGNPEPADQRHRHRMRLGMQAMVCMQQFENVLVEGTRMHAWIKIAKELNERPELISDPRSRSVFLEMSVDAFLNHDYIYSSANYWVYLLVQAILDEQERGITLPLFLQSMAHTCGYPFIHAASEYHLFGAASKGGQHKTFWGTPYVNWPAETTKEEAMQPAKRLLEKASHIAQGEPELLYALLKNPMVLCECLRYEDPYDPLFEKRDMSGSCASWPKPQYSSKQHAYLATCQTCKRAPGRDEKFQSCVKCRRARYCCRKCQIKDWPEHKKVCGKKRAKWWSRAAREKPARSEQGRS